MGLFSKTQFLKVIEWMDDSKDVIVYRYPLTDRDAIMNSSTLVVRESQAAIFMHKGQICDVFAPGTYTLSTENIPIISKIFNYPTGGEYRVTADIWYVNTKQLTGLKWGTTNPVMLRDNDFGNIRIRAHGVYSFKVDNVVTFMKEMFGTNQLFTTSDVAEQAKPLVLQAFIDAVGESHIAALDLAANYREFGKTVVESSEEEFGKFGLKLTSLVIENISLPAEVEKALDERTQMGIMSDKMGTYTQYQAANAMRDAAKNPSGNNMVGLGVGLGAGVGVGGLFSNSLKDVKDTPKDTPKKEEGTKVCPECKANIKASMKFCPECGAKQPVAKFCPECGHKVNEGAKFCPECGHKL